MSNNTHTTYYNSMGQEIPSVTQVLKLYGKHLESWANWIGRKGIDYKTYLMERAELGTYVHSVCEKFFSKDLEVDKHPDTKYLSPQDYQILLSRLEYTLILMKNKGYEPYAQELKISGETYGGTIDLVFYNKTNDKYIVIDLKTAKNAHDTMYMQLMAYCQLLTEKHNIHVSEVAILLITKDPDDKDFCKFYSTDDIQMIRKYKIFEYLLNIYYLLTDGERKKLLSV